MMSMHKGILWAIVITASGSIMQAEWPSFFRGILRGDPVSASFELRKFSKGGHTRDNNDFDFLIIVEPKKPATNLTTGIARFFNPHGAFYYSSTLGSKHYQDAHWNRVSKDSGQVAAFEKRCANFEKYIRDKYLPPSIDAERRTSLHINEPQEMNVPKPTARQPEGVKPGEQQKVRAGEEEDPILKKAIEEYTYLKREYKPCRVMENITLGAIDSVSHYWTSLYDAVKNFAHSMGVEMPDFRREWSNRSVFLTGLAAGGAVLAAVATYKGWINPSDYVPSRATIGTTIESLGGKVSTLGKKIVPSTPAVAIPPVVTSE
jgi:hypothetical protein